MRGQAGADTLSGGAGNDLLGGANADDTMTGGSGADIFKFALLQGANVIADLDVGADMLSFVGRGLADLARITATAEGASPTLAVLTMGVFADDITAGLFVGG